MDRLNDVKDPTGVGEILKTWLKYSSFGNNQLNILIEKRTNKI